jgi:Leucine-rich repeat (LRR) protein
MSALSNLSLSSNNLSGRIPASLGNVSSLVGIHLDLNNVDGSIPETLSQIKNLRLLVLHGNSLSGHVPAQLYNISSLVRLDLSQNNLAGTIPSSNEFSPPNLQILIMSSNIIEGSIPASLANSSNLQKIDLSNNSISGEIPSSLWNLSNLVVLRLSQNKLSGQITPAVGNLRQLSELSLDSNSLGGYIPSSLGQCKQLTKLNLSVNDLNGNIPTQLLNITTLQSLDLSGNYLIGSVPQKNSLINLAVLNISNNHLSGQIPSSLGQCVVLSFLNMEHNLLDGIIPQSFMNLKAIQQMNLSRNNFTGKIPDFFYSFTALEDLDLSFNNFEGPSPVPANGYFRKGTVVNLYGNTKLCTSVSMFALPICSTSKVKIKINTRVLLIVAPPIIIAFFSVLSCMMTLLKKRTHTAPIYKETMKKVSYGDILKATNWLSPVSKISSSHTSSIYIGRFEFDTDLVAIKVFHLDEHGSLNNFLMECEVLRNTRHRNLMKSVTLCSTVDLENNEFKAIVFDFMANGSLDMWVHPKLYQNSPKRSLSLGQRIRIAMDVASALDYMHNQLTPPLVHCDLKPANVLLDYDMTARVGDFGSAKFLSSGLRSPEGFVTIGGTIGYIAPGESTFAICFMIFFSLLTWNNIILWRCNME